MNKLFLSRVKSFSKEEKGATMFEYAILVGVIALVAIGGAMAFGSKLHTLFQAEGNAVTNVGNNAPTTN
jgi:pilus assembly protein Flp/PilA